MIVTITGDRNWQHPEIVDQAIARLKEEDIVVLGDCPTGADHEAGIFCLEEGQLHTVCFADWKRFGKSAGPIRNTAMLDTMQMLAENGNRTEPHTQVVWYFHDDLAKSKGTKNLVNQAKKRGLRILNGRDVAEGIDFV